MYKGVKPMWEQLGFDSNEFNIPSENQYWGNIIPKDYTVLDRNGVTTQQLEDPMDGSLTPRIPREDVSRVSSTSPEILVLFGR